MPAGTSVPTASTGAQPAPRDPSPPCPPQKKSSPPHRASLPDVFSRNSAALSSPALPRRRSPPRGRRRPQPKATRSVADMLRVRPPPPLTLRLAPQGGAPLTQWRTRPQRLRHPSPHCRSGSSTAVPARKRPSPLLLVPPGRRADTSGGLVGEAAGA